MEAFGFYNGKMHFKNYAIQCYKISSRRKLKTFCIQKNALFLRIFNLFSMENIMQNISQLFIFIIQSPSKARGLGNENGRLHRNCVLGGLGGFPPHYRAYLAPLCAERGGLGGILPPILGRKDFGGPGEAGEKGGSGRGSAAPSVVVVCLSVCSGAN